MTALSQDTNDALFPVPPIHAEPDRCDSWGLPLLDQVVSSSCRPSA